MGGAGGEPYWGGADSDVLGGESPSVGRCGGGRAGRRAACVGRGWSVGAATVAWVRAGGI